MATWKQCPFFGPAIKNGILHKEISDATDHTTDPVSLPPYLSTT
jgi:hypothetical protein